ncbi:MAG TPA: GNAT family N-acetyltransferase [Acidimicrobiales bacterium]|nr:GNAT family N-acetyltransferase [Acidimicrobiales bacterium]
MAIEYRHDIDGIHPEQLEGFFVGWPNPPSPTNHLRLLQGSDAIVVACDVDQIVGFVTAITDGVLAAYIPLLEVLPSHQGRGIASALIARLLDAIGDLYMVDTACDDDLVPFYERFNMQRGNAMVRRSYASQSGRPKPP